MSVDDDEDEGTLHTDIAELIIASEPALPEMDEDVVTVVLMALTSNIGAILLRERQMHGEATYKKMLQAVMASCRLNAEEIDEAEYSAIVMSDVQ